MNYLIFCCFVLQSPYDWDKGSPHPSLPLLRLSSKKFSGPFFVSEANRAGTGSVRAQIFKTLMRSFSLSRTIFIVLTFTILVAQGFLFQSLVPRGLGSNLLSEEVFSCDVATSTDVLSTTQRR